MKVKFRLQSMDDLELFTLESYITTPIIIDRTMIFGAYDLT